MKLELPNVPASALARRVVKTLRARGHVAWLAGGCVRDLLLGRTPKDYDVATDARPEEVEAAFEKSIPVGKSFGVITVQGEVDGVQVEVATFRHDGPYSDGRHPDSVRFTDAHEDAARRDFTINALYLDPESGEVIDYVQGVQDLKARLVRAVGDPAVRFAEDKLRLLRAIRFACALNFELDDATFAALKRMAPQVVVCSAERIREELHRMLGSPGRSRALRLMLEAGLLDALLPEVAALEQQPSPGPAGNLLARALMTLDALANPSLSLAWSALLADAGEEAAASVLRRLKCSNELASRVRDIVADIPRLAGLDQLAQSALKRLLRRPHVDEWLELARARTLDLGADLAQVRFALTRLAAFRAQGPQSLWPQLPLNGEDLKALGLPPGPRYRELLSALEDEMLEGRVGTREGAFAFVKSRMDAREHGQ